MHFISQYNTIVLLTLLDTTGMISRAWGDISGHQQ